LLDPNSEYRFRSGSRSRLAKEALIFVRKSSRNLYNFSLYFLNIFVQLFIVLLDMIKKRKKRTMLHKIYIYSGKKPWVQILIRIHFKMVALDTYR